MFISAVACLNKKMSISVIIPYYNESETILATLESIASQDYKPDEVLLIDSGSSDSSSILIDQWIKENNANEYKNIYSGMMSPSSSINKGIRSSKNKLIAYIDCGLEIPINWLSSNYKLIKKNGDDMVSIKIYTAGKDIIDQSFISQTYGYKNKTVCLPGSIINKDIFKKIGYFIESVRAGYDIDFINKIEKSDINRSINKEVYLKYFNFNYCQSYLSGFKKVYVYSLSGWKTKGDFKPLIYIIMFFLFITILYSGQYYPLILYLLLRGIMIPFYKSNYEKVMLMPHRIIFNFIAGIIIELSRVFAYLNIFRIINKKVINNNG
tara:strand:- start:23 stop:991 length:969 start_codon:yes stop_codon:yes gene_type:complete